MAKARMIKSSKIVKEIEEIDLKEKMENKGIKRICDLAKLMNKDRDQVSNMVYGKKEFTAKYYEENFKKHLE
jgi:plasmid maintenance system antidote protein VapI|tara:strand:- start:1239 stop:1454 length:216 start_codon:yes stop_codon:yes gene_type:complete